MLKVYYQYVNLFAPVLGVCAAITLICPRNYLFMKMLQEQTEAIALLSFGSVLFVLCADEACHVHSAKDLDSDNVGAKMLAALNEEGEAPHYAVPPFACCFVKCMPQHLLRPIDIKVARTCIRQYAFVNIAGGMLALWCALSLTTETAKVIMTQIGRIRKLSAFVCIYGLFIFYKAMHHLLEKYSPTAKFISLKLVVVLMAYQEIIVKWMVGRHDAASEDCLAPNLPASSTQFKEIQDSNREHFSGMYLVALESILVAFLVKRAFPPSELKAKSGQMHGAVLELEFERLEAGKDLVSISEDEGSQTDDE